MRQRVLSGRCWEKGWEINHFIIAKLPAALFSFFPAKSQKKKQKKDILEHLQQITHSRGTFHSISFTHTHDLCIFQSDVRHTVCDAGERPQRSKLTTLTCCAAHNKRDTYALPCCCCCCSSLSSALLFFSPFFCSRFTFNFTRVLPFFAWWVCLVWNMFSIRASCLTPSLSATLSLQLDFLAMRSLSGCTIIKGIGRRYYWLSVRQSRVASLSGNLAWHCVSRIWFSI